MRRNLKIILAVGGVIAVVWLVPLFLTEESGLKFGLPYRVFFSLFTLFVGFLFYLLGAPPLPPFKSGRRALASVALVFVASIVLMVLLANLSPQFSFEGPAATGPAGPTPQERGRALTPSPQPSFEGPAATGPTPPERGSAVTPSPQFSFEGPAATGPTGPTPQERGRALTNDPNMGCFLCHKVNGVGGTRGPDLTHAATVAGQRRPGMSPEEYLREAIVNPGAYVVPTYDNIMPPSAQRLSSEGLDDLIAYLKTLK